MPIAFDKIVVAGVATEIAEKTILVTKLFSDWLHTRAVLGIPFVSLFRYKAVRSPGLAEEVVYLVSAQPLSS